MHRPGVLINAGRMICRSWTVDVVMSVVAATILFIMGLGSIGGRRRLSSEGRPRRLEYG